MTTVLVLASLIAVLIAFKTGRIKAVLGAAGGSKKMNPNGVQ